MGAYSYRGRKESRLCSPLSRFLFAASLPAVRTASGQERGQCRIEGGAGGAGRGRTRGSRSRKRRWRVSAPDRRPLPACNLEFIPPTVPYGQRNVMKVFLRHSDRLCSGQSTPMHHVQKFHPHFSCWFCRKVCKRVNRPFVLEAIISSRIIIGKLSCM